MRAFLTALVFVVSVASTFASRPPAAWAGLKMDGLIMDRQNSKAVERLFFSGSGDVAATIGVRHGQQAGVVFRWRIRGEWLELSESGRKVFQRLRAIKVDKSRLVAIDESGRRIIFTLSRRNA